MMFKSMAENNNEIILVLNTHDRKDLMLTSVDILNMDDIIELLKIFQDAGESFAKVTNFTISCVLLILGMIKAKLGENRYDKAFIKVIINKCVKKYKLDTPVNKIHS